MSLDNSPMPQSLENSRVANPEPLESQAHTLAEAIRLTEDMLACARAGKWDVVADREQIRRALLGSCFKQNLVKESRETVAEALAVILHLNEELLSVLTIARNESLEASRGSTQKRVAADEYRDVQSTS